MPLPSLERYAIGIRTAIALAAHHPVPNINLAEELAVFEPGVAGASAEIDASLDMGGALEQAIQNAPSQGAGKALKVLQLHVSAASGAVIST